VTSWYEARKNVGSRRRTQSVTQRFEAAKMLFVCFVLFIIGSFGSTMARTFFGRQMLDNPVTQLALKGLNFVPQALNPVSDITTGDLSDLDN
jgi:hypothetical protein